MYFWYLDDSCFQKPPKYLKDSNHSSDMEAIDNADCLSQCIAIKAALYFRFIISIEVLAAPLL